MQTIITLDDQNFGGKYCQAARVELIDNSGRHTAKYVDVSELMKALMGSKVEKKNKHYIGKLPQHYYDGALFRDERGRLNGEIILIIPKQKILVEFENTTYLIPYPNLLFYFSISKDQVKDTKVYALKGREWDHNSELYNYPFGNVNTYTHSVCWGSNSLPKIRELKKLDVVCSLFFDSATNNDYYVAKTSTKWELQNIRGIFEQLQHYEDFPEEILVLSNTKTMNVIIQKIKGGTFNE